MRIITEVYMIPFYEKEQIETDISFEIGTHLNQQLQNVRELNKYVFNPQMQYYTLLKKYQQEQKEFSVMPFIAINAKHIGNDSLAQNIADTYINDYLLRLSKDSLYTIRNILFMNLFTGDSKSKIF